MKSLYLNIKGREPYREWKCPECKVTFKANNKIKDGRNGKVCPNGHWHSIVHLKYFEQNGCLPATRGRVASAARSFQNAPKSGIHARHALENVGVGERTDQLTVALQWMLNSYDNAMATLPAGSQARAMVEAAFGKGVTLCREVLG